MKPVSNKQPNVKIPESVLRAQEKEAESKLRQPVDVQNVTPSVTKESAEDIDLKNWFVISRTLSYLIF
ncbi:MAG: hypothetical protein A2Y21_08480 [Clostridiales bacterium GWC2_40_7]|nr:MAG: hypothetical protein A2Y21_08480 [Clostridiales bacterium GWC2_40_7]